MYDSYSISTMDMAILHVKIVWLSVATITTFIIGVEFKISPGRSVKAMTHSMLNLKFLPESNEQKPTRNKEKTLPFERNFIFNSCQCKSASTCIYCQHRSVYKTFIEDTVAIVQYPSAKPRGNPRTRTVWTPLFSTLLEHALWLHQKQKKNEMNLSWKVLSR